MVPLGISIGDVIAVSKLLSTIISILRNSAKAASEYEELLLLLQSLQNTFRTVEAHMGAWRAPDSLDINHQSVLNALGIHLGQCQQALVQLHDSLLKYSRPPSKNVLARRMHEPRRNLQWRLSIQQDARLASEKLRPHMQALQLLLQASAMSAMSSLATRETSLTRCVDQLQSTLSTIATIRNARPMDLGYPLCGGILADHVWIRDGLGQESYLPMGLCYSFESFSSLLLLFFQNCPGEEHVARGQFEVLDRRFNQKLDTKTWSTHVKPGCQLEMAFVVGSWEKWVINYCVSCKRKNATGFRNCIECECGLSYEVLKARDVHYEYEPIDGDWMGEADQKLPLTAETRTRMQQDPEFRKAFLREDTDDSSQSSLEDGGTLNRIQCPSFLPWKQQALCFRRMIIVWDPIFNFTSRAMICRCIMAESASGSQAPRIDLEMELVCSRHAPTWWKLEKHAAKMPQRDYNSDPYFDKFGGYDMFRFYAVSTGGPYSRFHLDEDKLMSNYEFEHMQQEVITLETEETLKAARAYEKELYKHSKPWVEKRRKAGFYPDILEATREWQHLLEETRPDIVELDPDEVRFKDNKYKSKVSFVGDGELEIDFEL